VEGERERAERRGTRREGGGRRKRRERVWI
jgi:hypothetical protein